MSFVNSIESLESRRLLSAGDLDTSFGKGGTVTASFGGDVVESSVATQADGKIVVAMAVEPKGPTAGEMGNFVLARFTTSGALDKTFGTSGTFQLPLTDSGTDVVDPVIDSQNRILVATDDRLLRLTPAGKLDASFGQGGVANLPVSHFALRQNGKIIALVAGNVERLSADGLLDKTFGKSGVVKIDFDNETSPPGKLTPDGLLVDHDGRTYVEVYGGDWDSSNTEGGFIRITASGKIDKSYFGNGYNDFVPSDFFIVGMAVTPDDKIVVNEDCEEGTADLVEINSQGKIDKSFSGGNRSLEDIEQGEPGEVLPLANGQLMVDVSDERDGFELVRVNVNGTLDPAFAGDGRAIMPYHNAPSIATDSNGDIIASASAGVRSDGYSAGGDLELIRVKSSPPVAPPSGVSLNASGKLVIYGTGGDDSITVWVDEASSYALLNNLVVNVNGTWEYFDRTKVKSILIDSGGGNDNVEVGLNVPATLNGGDGDDILYGGNGPNLINGEAGNDQLTGGDAPDTLIGGDGDDQLQGGKGNNNVNGGSGNDFIIDLGGADTDYGGAGNDTLSCSGQTAALSISLDNIANDGRAGEKANVHSDIENIVGGEGNDLLIGSASDNNLEGLSGEDTIWGGAGHDTLLGDDGNDVFHAKDGQADTIDGGQYDKDTIDKASVDPIDVVTHIEKIV